MELILDSIDGACNQGNVFPGIITALTIPDIAGAVDNPSLLSGPRYVRWLDHWFASRHSTYGEHGIDSHAIYALRCRLLHEGATDPSKATAARKSAAASNKRMIAFNVGPGLSLHLCTSTSSQGESMTILRGETFCSDMTDAARAWLSTSRADPETNARIKSIVDLRFDVPPLSKGVPLICALI